MVDLTEFAGEGAMRTSLLKKREKAQEKLDTHIAKAQEKIKPLQDVIDKLDALLDVLNKSGVKGAVQVDANSAGDAEEQETLDRADLPIPQGEGA